MIKGLEKATPSTGSVEGTRSLQACRNLLTVTSSCEKAVETLAKNPISHRHLGKSDHTREPCLEGETQTLQTQTRRGLLDFLFAPVLGYRARNGVLADSNADGARARGRGACWTGWPVVGTAPERGVWSR